MFTKGQWITLGVIAVAVLLVVVGCAPSSTPPTPTVTIPKALIGTYKTTITEKDARAQNYLLNDLVGDFEIQFMEGGFLRVNLQNSGTATGEYTATQDTIAFGVDSGQLSCTAVGYASGTYKWSSDGKSLTFTKVNDGCFGRVLALTAHPLIKAQ